MKTKQHILISDIKPYSIIVPLIIVEIITWVVLFLASGHRTITSYFETGQGLAVSLGFGIILILVMLYLRIKHIGYITIEKGELETKLSYDFKGQKYKALIRNQGIWWNYILEPKVPSISLTPFMTTTTSASRANKLNLWLCLELENGQKVFIHEIYQQWKEQPRGVKYSAQESQIVEGNFEIPSYFWTSTNLNKTYSKLFS